MITDREANAGARLTCSAAKVSLKHVNREQLAAYQGLHLHCGVSSDACTESYSEPNAHRRGTSDKLACDKWERSNAKATGAQRLAAK